MGKNSGVTWCDSSHGFWYGCRQTSSGCKNCYAKAQMARTALDFNKVTRAKGFNKPLSWKEPAKIFVNPWSDFFIADADKWRDDAWDIMRKTPHLTYLLLTKRPENIADRLPVDWPLPNVWLGVTAENQEMANFRIPILLQTVSVKHFVSIEPQVGSVDLRTIDYIDSEGFSMSLNSLTGEHWPCLGNADEEANNVLHGDALDWVIVGGESGGPEARPCHPEWVRSLRDQCACAGTPFLFKQFGEWLHNDIVWDAIDKNKEGEKLLAPVQKIVSGERFYRVGTKKSGHLLDGKEHMEFPVER